MFPGYLREIIYVEATYNILEVQRDFFLRLLLARNPYNPRAQIGASTAIMVPRGKTGVGIEGSTWILKTSGVPAPPLAVMGVNVKVQLPLASKFTEVGPQISGEPVQVKVGSLGRLLLLPPAPTGGVVDKSTEVSAGVVELSCRLNSETPCGIVQRGGH